MYFNDLTDTISRFSSPIPENVIQPNDILSISISSPNPEASAIFNQPNTSGQGGGYIVNSEGNIQLPLLGTIHTAGLTTNQLRTNITRTLLERKLLVDPIVNVQNTSFNVTILGEVGGPKVITVPSERITILQALGMVGDLTIYGRRDNILLIREENGQRTVKRLNLSSKELLRSPYYYLKSNDVIYVEPNSIRIGRESRGQQILPYVLTGISLVLTTVSYILYRR
ncbi:MAG: polysaccharide biosynthesis/export family protein [Bacteroidota bacterium]|nr:polysaccharide biosynthesis/export family protein [Bacteroidota bacterium]